MTKIQKQSIEIARAAFPVDFGAKRTLHFSFLYKGSKLLCFAENSEKTHARNRFNCDWDLGLKGTCSELACFVKSRRIKDLNWNKVTMINVRLGRKMEVLNSAPCRSCFNLLVKYLKVRNIVHTNQFGSFSEIQKY